MACIFFTFIQIVCAASSLLQVASESRVADFTGSGENQAAAAVTNADSKGKVNRDNCETGYWWSMDDGTSDALLEAAVTVAVFAIVVIARKLAHRRSCTKKAAGHISTPWKQGPAKAKSSNTKAVAADRAPRALTASTTNSIAAAVAAGKATDLPRLLDDAQEAGTADSEHLLSALRACAAHHSFREALVAYDHVHERIGKACGSIWSILLYSAVQVGEYKRGEEFYLKLRSDGSTPSKYDVINMVRVYANDFDFSGLQWLLKDLAHANCQLDCFTRNRALAACCAVEGGLKFAEALAADCNRIFAEPMDVVGYNTLIKGHARDRNLPRCLELKAMMQMQGLQPSDVTFGILLDASVGAKEVDVANEIFEDLRKSGLRLNAVHCTTLLKGLVGVGRLDEAANVLKEMNHSQSTKPDLITYSTLLRAYADVGDVRAAMKLLISMKSQGLVPDEIAYNAVIGGFSVCPHRADEIAKVFDELIDSGLKPSTTTLSILIKALSRGSHWQAALKLLQEAPDRFGRRQVELRLYSQLVNACLKGGPTAIVVQVYEAMVAFYAQSGQNIPEPDNNRLLKTCLSQGDLQKAMRLCDAMERLGCAIQASVVSAVRSGRRCRR